MSILPRYLVIGAGNGGCAMAAELVLRGRDVVLFDYPAFESRLAPLRAAGGIHVESRVAHFARGVGVHFARLPELSTDITVAAATDVIIVVVPGQHHAQVIEAILPHLRPGHLVLLNPGGVGGALIWADALRRAGHQDILLAQAADLLYAGFRTPKRKSLLPTRRSAHRSACFRIGCTTGRWRCWRTTSRNSCWRRTCWRLDCKGRACWCTRCRC
jgi:hypothetical protein